MIKVSWSSLISTPPNISDCAALNSISLYSGNTTASRTAPSPFPPLIVAEISLLILKSCGSTWTSLTDPLTTAFTNAVVPIPTDGDPIVIVGGLITS